MSNDIKLHLALEGTQGVVTGTQAVGTALDRMEQSGTSAGQTVGKALDQMGQSGATAGQVVSAGAKRVGESLDQMGRSGTTAAQAVGAGSGRVGDELRRMGQAGQISAGQTAAAFRQLPMQLQDVAVSLQGGMNPFTVLMQQGPQITSSFGGVAPTIRALGPAVLGLLNPFTLAAAAGAALFLVYEAGRGESAAYARTLIMTGNAAGTTAGQLGAMAQRLDGIAGTQGKAADVLTQLAGAGGVARDMLERTAAAAIALERAGGPAAEATVKAFSALGKDPLQASIKLNESTNYLTASTIRQIKALEDAGNATGAAKVAQEAYASAIEQRTPELEKQLGTLQRGWRNIGDAAAWAWDKMLNVGRERGVDDQLKSANEHLARLQADIKARYGDSGPRDNSKAAQELRAAAAKVQALEASAKYAQAAAQADATRAADAAKTVEDLKAEPAVYAANAALVLAQVRASSAVKTRAAEDDAARLDNLRQQGLISEQTAAQQSIAIEQNKLRAKLAVTNQQITSESARPVAAKDTAAVQAKAAALASLRAERDALQAEMDRVPVTIGVKIQQLDLSQARSDAEAWADAWKRADAQIRANADQIAKALADQIVDPLARAQAQANLAAAAVTRNADTLGRTLQTQIDVLRGRGGEANRAMADTLQAQADVMAAGAKANAALISAKPSTDGAVSAEQRLQALQDEVKAIDMARTGNLTLAQAIEVVATQRLLEARAKAVANKDADHVAAIDREIEARKKLGSMTAAKDFAGTNFSMQIGNGFDKASQSLSAFSNSFMGLITLQEQYNKIRNEGSPELQAANAKKFALAQINAYGTMAGAAKGFFKEGSAGYKALGAAEKVFRAFEMGNAIRDAAIKIGLIGSVTTAKVAGDAAQESSLLASAGKQIAAFFGIGTASASAGVANQAGGDPYTAFPRMAAMAALMAGLGFATGAIGGGKTYAPKNNDGTGTVLGDSTAKSESIAKSIEALADVDTLTMRYSAQMLASLRNIEASLGGVASLIFRNGGMGALEGQAGVGFKDNALRFLEPFGRTGVFGTKTTVQGGGIQAGPQSLGDIMNGGLDASFYTDVQKKKKAFGITYSTKNSTILSDAGAELEQQFGLVLRGMADTVSTASAALGQPLADVQSRVASFVVNLGRIELKGLDGKAVQERLANVFGAEGDRLAQAVLPGLGDFQRIGEGYLETITRVASGVEVGTAALDRLGVQVSGFAGIANKQGDVGAELVRDSLVAAETTVRAGVSSIGEILSTLDGSAGDLADTYRALTDIRTSLQLLGLGATDVTRDLIKGAGDLGALTSGLADYEKGFFTEAEQTAAKTGRLRREFERLGLTMPSTTAGFRALVEGIDGTTAEGQQLQGALFTLSSQFLDVADAAAGAGAALTDEIKRIRGLTAQGGGKAKTFAEGQANFAITTARARAGDAAAMAALPEASRALLDLADQGARTPAALLALQNSVADSLQATLDLTQPQNGTAPGAAAITGGAVAGVPIAAAPVPAAVGLSATQTNADMLTELRGLRAEVAALREEQETNGGITATATDRMQRLLARIAPNDALLTRTLG